MQAQNSALRRRDEPIHNWSCVFSLSRRRILETFLWWLTQRYPAENKILERRHLRGIGREVLPVLRQARLVEDDIRSSKSGA